MVHSLVLEANAADLNMGVSVNDDGELTGSIVAEVVGEDMNLECTGTTNGVPGQARQVSGETRMLLAYGTVESSQSLGRCSTWTDMPPAGRATPNRSLGLASPSHTSFS